MKTETKHTYLNKALAMSALSLVLAAPVAMAERTDQGTAQADTMPREEGIAGETGNRSEMQIQNEQTEERTAQTGRSNEEPLWRPDSQTDERGPQAGAAEKREDVEMEGSDEGRTAESQSEAEADRQADRTAETGAETQQQDQLTAAESSQLQGMSVEELADQEVANLQGENVGQVEDVVRSQDGSDTGLVVSVGGFWGIGGKQILVDLDDVRVSENQDQIVWETNATEDELKDMPEYDEANYVSIR